MDDSQFDVVFGFVTNKDAFAISNISLNELFVSPIMIDFDIIDMVMIGWQHYSM